MRFHFSNKLLSLSFALLVLGTAALSLPQANAQNANYDESKVPQYVLPDPLVANDGSKIDTPEAWKNIRRPEILKQFQTEMFGKFPEADLSKLKFEDVMTYDKFLDGKATVKIVRVYFNYPEKAPKMDLMLVLPNSKKDQPVPAFLMPNFQGLHTTTDDVNIPAETFEAATRFRRLNQGEYLAKPDSIVYPGDTLTIVRPANDSTKYYLRQDHYVWLADLKKGDSLVIYHEMDGYCKYMECKGTPRASYWIIDAKGDSVGTISSLDHSFKAKKDGPVYLRYLQLNSKALTDSNLTLRTFIQRPGSLDSLKFYNEAKDETYSTKRVKAGDTVKLSEFAFQTVPYKTSYNVKWFVPCEDLTTLGNAAYINQLDNCKGEQEISSFYLIAQSDATDKDARLIAQSMADPLMRDTLTINVR